MTTWAGGGAGWGADADAGCLNWQGLAQTVYFACAHLRTEKEPKAVRIVGNVARRPEGRVSPSRLRRFGEIWLVAHLDVITTRKGIRLGLHSLKGASGV